MRRPGPAALPEAPTSSVAAPALSSVYLRSSLSAFRAKATPAVVPAPLATDVVSEPPHRLRVCSVPKVTIRALGSTSIVTLSLSLPLVEVRASL